MPITTTDMALDQTGKTTTTRPRPPETLRTSQAYGIEHQESEWLRYLTVDRSARVRDHA